jgi:opacity protein-like surface antigen
MRTKPISVFVLCAVVVLLMAARTKAEWVISGYLGKADTADADVKLSEQGGTNLKFHNVSWDDESFDGPMYYGVRLTKWFDRSPKWGLALDFTHPKMVARLNETVNVTGTRAGVPVSGPERLGDTFDVLEFTHGHNLLTLNGMYRRPGAGRDAESFLARLEPYAGLGAGVAIPHAEVTTSTGSTYEYQLVGFAAQGLVGVSYEFVRNVSVFTEYKLSYADMDVDIHNGGSLKIGPWTHHFILGFSYSFR